MLEIKIDDCEFWDNSKEEFFIINGGTLKLEHSLKSISEWEAIYEVPFMEKAAKNLDEKETMDYIKCMTLNREECNDKMYMSITMEQIDKIKEYIEKPSTATTFYDLKSKIGFNGSRKKEIVTSEVIYFWMIQAGIPFECENWNFNRLMTLLRVSAIKSNNKKMSKRESMEFNKALMAERRAAHGKH